MNEFESRLRDELRTRAERVTATSPMAERARRTARRMRIRRAAAGGVLVAAASAIAVPVAVSLQDAPRTAPEPAAPETDDSAFDGTPDGTPEPVQPDGDGTTALDLAEMDAGAPPEIAWIANELLHTADGRTLSTPEASDDELWEPVLPLAPFGDGLVGLVFPDAGTQIAIVGAGGELSTYRGNGPVISADGDLVAWYDADTSRLRFAAADGESAPDPIDVPQGQPLAPVGFAGSEALIVNVGDGLYSSTGVRRYDLSDGSATSMPDALLGAMTVSQSGQVFGLTEQRDFDSCSALFPADGAQPLWRTCEYRFSQFSDDGRLLLGTDINSGGRGDAYAVVIDARTGELVHRFDAAEGGHINRAAFEGESHVLMAYATSDDPEADNAIVRCSLAGECERATDVRAQFGDDHTNFDLAVQP